MTRILLVTGSRTLADRADATDVNVWCEGEIARAVREHDIDTIVCGDARGPDRWALVHAASFKLRSVCYIAQTGEVRTQRGIEAGTFGHWHLDIASIETGKRALHRNAVMVDHVARRDPRAIVLGFIDSSPARKTRGTEHTMSCARERGLSVTACVWGLSNEVKHDQA